MAIFANTTGKKKYIYSMRPSSSRYLEKKRQCHSWWLAPLILALWRQRQEDFEFEVNLDCVQWVPGQYGLHSKILSKNQINQETWQKQPWLKAWQAKEFSANGVQKDNIEMKRFWKTKEIVNWIFFTVIINKAYNKENFNLLTEKSMR
jgi:hypothetical protein